MKEKTTNSTKKIIIILLITLIGMAVSVLIWNISKQSFLFLKQDRYMDYFNTLKVSKNVYSDVGTGRGYFPFTYILLNIIDFIIYDSYASYFITFIWVCIFLILFYSVFLKKWNLLGITLITFLSYPLIFAFDRGNIEYLVLALLLLFFIFYKKEKYKTAAVLLAFPICMKLYPAVFILLFIKKKKLKEFFVCGIASILTMIASYCLLGGTLKSIPIAIDNFSYFTDVYALTKNGVQFSHTVWSSMNYCNLLLSNTLINADYITIYTISIAIISLFLTAYIIFIEKEEWKIITILTVMMITFPHVSFDYTLIHMYIPIVFFIMSKNTTKKEGILYSVLFGMTIIPMNWFQYIQNRTTLNLGLIVRPVILITIIAIIVITGLKNKKTNIKTELIEKR